MKKYLLIRILVPFTAILIILTLFLFRGADLYFWQGEKFAQKGKYEKALDRYQICAERYPKYRRAPEAWLRIAEIYDYKLGLCRKAKKIYKKIMEKYPQSQWAELAQEKIKHCYDYFPLNKGNLWVEGDSETGGKNYRAEIYCIEPYKIVKKVYAGKKLVTSIELTYSKDEKEFREYTPSSGERTLFCYPLKKGRTWTAGDGLEEIVYTLTSKDAQVETKAGKFSDCLKIRQEKKTAPGSFRFDYYAPEIGKVLVTQATLRNPQEVRISELLSYKIVED